MDELEDERPTGDDALATREEVLANDAALRAGSASREEVAGRPRTNVSRTDDLPLL